jgi:hypothetical protein
VFPLFFFVCDSIHFGGSTKEEGKEISYRSPCRKGKRRALIDVMDHWVISLMLAVAFTAAASSSSELMDDDDSVGHLFDIDVRSDGESQFQNKNKLQKFTI